MVSGDGWARAIEREASAFEHLRWEKLPQEVEWALAPQTAEQPGLT